MPKDQGHNVPIATDVRLALDKSVEAKLVSKLRIIAANSAKTNDRYPLNKFVN